MVRTVLEPVTFRATLKPRSSLSYKLEPKTRWYCFEVWLVYRLMLQSYNVVFDTLCIIRSLGCYSKLELGQTRELSSNVIQNTY